MDEEVTTYLKILYTCNARVLLKFYINNILWSTNEPGNAGMPKPKIVQPPPPPM